MLGLRPRNQHVARYKKGQAVELSLAGDVLDGFAMISALNELSVSSGLILGKIVVSVSKEPGRVLLQQMEQQGLCVAARSVGVRTQ
jgi:hypothetical protein